MLKGIASLLYVPVRRKSVGSHVLIDFRVHFVIKIECARLALVAAAIAIMDDEATERLSLTRTFFNSLPELCSERLQNNTLVVEV